MMYGKAAILGGLLLSVCALVYVLALVAFSMSGATWGQQLTNLVQLVGFFAYPVVGSLIVSRRPSNTVGWLFCAIGLGTATTAFSAGYITHALATHADTQLATGIIDALGSSVWLLNLGLGALLLLLFPDGRPLSRRWRVVYWFAVAMIAAASLAALLQPGPLESNGRVVNPLGITAARSILVTLNFVTHLLFLPLVLLAIISVIVRYRRASGIQRQQIKWFALGAAAMAVIICITVFAFPDENSAASTIGFALAFAMLPIGAGIGVLRYRLYDIDILINRTLVYGSLSAVLASVYFACVIGTQAIIQAVSGNTNTPPVLIVASTLLVVALFNPLRHRIQAGIDRRFYRRKYDATRTLAAFGATLRTETDLTNLSQHLVSVVNETMQPTQVSLWLHASADIVSQDRSPRGARP
jgi:hypothetical protein